MRGRQKAILAGLGIFVVFGLAVGWLLLDPPQASRRGGKAQTGSEVVPWERDLAKVADEPGRSSRRGDSAGDTVAANAPGADDESTEGESAALSASDSGDAGFPEETSEIDPEEIAGPIPGYLIVRVEDEDYERAVPGASIYLPLADTKLESDGGEVKVPVEIAELRRRTNRFGIAVWKASELTKLLGDQQTSSARLSSSVSMLVTAPGYADLFEPVQLPQVGKEGAEISLKMFSAVRVTGKARIKRSGIAADLKIEVHQTSRQGASDGKPANSFSITTDNVGEFSLKIADRYLYQFEVQQSGYVPYKSQIFDFRRGEREVSIIIEEARGISGVVVDDKGQGVPLALVDMRIEGVSVETDDDGKFVVDMVKDRIHSNDVYLRVTKEGYAPTMAKVLANDRDVKITLLPEGSLSGVVKNEDGQAVAGAVISCTYLEGRARYPWDAALSDEEGNFSFTGFGDGRVLLSATYEGLVSSAQTIDVKANKQAGPIELKLKLGASISGTVSVDGVAVSGVTIYLDDQPTAASDDAGAYLLDGLDQGKHKVRIVNQYPITDDRLRQLPIFTVDGEHFYYLPAEQTVKLKLGQATTVDFALSPFEVSVDRTITVRILTEPREAAAGVQVTVTPVLGSPPEGVQKPSAQTFPVDLPDGSLEVEVSLLNGVSYEATFVHNRYFTAKLSAAAIDETGDGGLVEVVLDRAFMITGYVRDSEGNGIEGVGLSSDRKNPWNMTAHTDIHGYFEFGQLKEGGYLVSAFKTSYYQEQIEVEVKDHDPDPMAISLVGANEIRIIVTGNGVPQPGAHVHIYRDDATGDNPDNFKRHFDLGTTDANGVKYINFHWERNYQVVAYYGEEVAFVNFDNLKEEPEREFSIELEPGYDITGSLVDSYTGSGIADVDIRVHLEPTGIEGRDGNLFQSRTDSAGNFGFRVPAGSYHFYAPKTRTHQSLDTSGSPVEAGTTGILLEAELRDDIEGNWAQVLGFTAPDQMIAGESYEVSVTMKNSGSTTWTAAGNKPWRLGSQAKQDNKTWGTNRISLPEGVSVAPGETWTFTFTVKAPSKAGTYNMQWRMVQDGVEWFGEYTPIRAVVVSSPPQD